MGMFDPVIGLFRGRKKPPASKLEVVKNPVTLQFYRANVDTANMTGLVNSTNVALNQLKQNKQIDNFTVDQNQQRGGEPAVVVSVFTDSSRQNTVIDSMHKLEFEGPEKI
jgi:hypothetical protein